MILLLNHDVFVAFDPAVKTLPEISLAGYSLFTHPAWWTSHGTARLVAKQAGLQDSITVSPSIIPDYPVLSTLFDHYKKMDLDIHPIKIDSAILMVSYQQADNEEKYGLLKVPHGCNYRIFKAQLSLWQLGGLSPKISDEIPKSVTDAIDETLGLSGKFGIHESINSLVLLVQQSLYFYGLLHHSHIEGFVCDDTLIALEKFYFEFGPFPQTQIGRKPWCDLTIITRVIETFDFLKQRLKELGFKPNKSMSRNDPNTFRKQVKHFQRSNAISVTGKMDIATRIKLNNSRRLSSAVIHRGMGKLEEMVGLGANPEQPFSLNDLLASILEPDDKQAYKTPIKSSTEETHGYHFRINTDLLTLPQMYLHGKQSLSPSDPNKSNIPDPVAYRRDSVTIQRKDCSLTQMKQCSEPTRIIRYSRSTNDLQFGVNTQQKMVRSASFSGTSMALKSQLFEVPKTSESVLEMSQASIFTLNAANELKVRCIKTCIDETQVLVGKIGDSVAIFNDETKTLRDNLADNLVIIKATHLDFRRVYREILQFRDKLREFNESLGVSVRSNSKSETVS